MLMHSVSKILSLLPAASLVFALMASPAKADAIDGDWCNADGENLRIDGSAIRTPGGTSMTGDYGRHYFSYVSPPDEKYAGETLNMTQHSEELMSMKLPDGSDVTWRRCEAVS